MTVDKPMRLSARTLTIALATCLILGPTACDDSGTGLTVQHDAAYEGTYALAPVPTTTCVMDTYGNWTVHIDAIRVHDATPDSLQLTLVVRVVSSPATFDAEVAAGGVALDPVARSFAGSGPIAFTVSGGGFTATGSGASSIQGGFSGTGSFAANIAATVQLTIQDSFGGSLTRSCTDVSVNVTGTR